MAAQQDDLTFVPIVGPGVDALENRKEHNNNTKVSADSLRERINKVKTQNFSAIKKLVGAAKVLAAH